MKRLAFIALALGVFALGTQLGALADANFAGTWACAASGEGPNGDQIGKFPLVLKQSGSTVTGSYYDGSASLKGTLKGNTLTGTWKESSGTGVFTFVMADDGKSFTGTWGVKAGSTSGTWSGNKQ